MVNPLSLEALMELRGSPVIDRAGEEVGVIADVYYDRDTRVPEWVAVSTDFYGNRLLVPVTQAEAAGGSLRVPHERSTILATPSFDEREIDESMERELYRHYGISYSQRSSATVLPENIDVSTTGNESTVSHEDVMPPSSTSQPRSAGDARMSPAARLEAEGSVAPETAAPFPTLEPEAATAPENARAAPRAGSPGPPPFETSLDEKQSLDDDAIVMTDMPADVPGMLLDTGPQKSRKRPRTLIAVAPALAAAAALVVLLRVRRTRHRHSAVA